MTLATPSAANVVWIALTVLLNSAGVTAALAMLWVFKRFPKVIGFMGRKVSMLTLAGVAFGYAAGIVLVLPHGCTYASFAFALSCSLMLGAHLCKTIAIDKVFNNESLKVVTFSEAKQAALVALGAATELGLVAAMFVISPLEQVEVDGGALCEGDSTTAGFLATLFVWHFALHLLTLKTARRTHAKDGVARRYQTYLAAALSLGFHATCLTLVLPMLFAPGTASGHVAFSPTTVVMINFLGVTGCFVAITLKPFWEFVLYPDQRFVVTQSALKVANASSSAKDTELAMRETWRELCARLGEQPSWVCIYPTVAHAAQTVSGLVSELIPSDVPVHGASSCAQVMTENGPVGHNGCAVGMWAVYDPQGEYHSVTVEEVGDSVETCTKRIRDALQPLLQLHTKKVDMIWLGGSPGTEEMVLQAIHAVVGDSIPVYGGSSGDNDISGGWYQFSRGTWMTSGAVLTTVSASVEISGAFFSGYSPTSKSAKVTNAEGRNLLELDGRPAAEVYNEWTQQHIAEFMRSHAPAAQRNILAASSIYPLGRLLGYPDDYSEPFFQLMHPNEVLPDLGLNLFAEVTEGDTLTLMAGTHENLQTRIANAALHCTKGRGIEPSEIRGALVIFCAGCMLTIQSDMDKACRNLSRALGGCPFVGAHCFGEQGEFPACGSKHGNLMFGTVVFTSRPKEPETHDRGSLLYLAMRAEGMRVPGFLQPFSKEGVKERASKVSSGASDATTCASSVSGSSFRATKVAPSNT